MHSFLFVGDRVDKDITDYCLSHKLTLIPFTVKTIKEARELKKMLLTTPNYNCAYLLKNIDEASIDALNALLKLIEEPPFNTYFILTTRNSSRVIPTIISRCEVIRSREIVPVTIDEQILNLSLDQRLKLIENIKTRIDAINFISNVIRECELKLTTSNDIRGLTKTLAFAHQSYIYLEANGNIKLNLYNFVIQSYL